jgi:DNA-binding transcriptional LysR family regulator
VNLNSIDFNKLAIFSKVVEAGNYRLASEILNVTPSALSQTITSLEHSLGIPLFHRFGKKLVLTEDGAKIQREFKTYHEEFTRVLLRISDKSEEVVGLIRVGAYLEFAKFQLSPILTAFQRKHPHIQVKLVFDTPSRLHRMLEENKIDICFSIYPERDSKLIRSQPIYQEELLLVSPSGMLSDKPGIQEIVSAPIVEYYFNHQPIRRWLMLHFKKKPKQLPIRTYGATAEMVLALVQEGMGIGVVPEYLLRTKVLNSLSICRPTNRKLVDHIWMLQLKNRARLPALEAFTTEVETAFKFSDKL